MDTMGILSCNTLILGIGNTVMADDGVGPAIICRLQQEYSFPDSVELMDGGTLGLDLLPKLENLHRLILLDAIDMGEKPGAWKRLYGDEIPVALETKLSPHQMGVKDLLAVSQLMGHTPCEMILYGVQPGSIEMSTELTNPVQNAMETVITAILQELKTLEIRFEKKPNNKSKLQKGNSSCHTL